MRTDLCRDLFHHLDRDGSLQMEPAPKPFIAWVSKLKLPHGVEMLLRHDWPQKDGNIGSFGINTSLQIMEEEHQPALLKFGMLEIGGAGNGDPLVLRMTDDSCEVGLVSHEEFWDYENSLMEIYQPIAPSFEDFLHRIVEEKYIPLDYFVAKELNELKREQSNSPD